MPKMNWKRYLIPLHRLLTRVSRAPSLSSFEALRQDPKQCVFWILHRQRAVKFCTVASWRPLLLHKYFSSPCDAPESVSLIGDAHFSETFSLQHELSESLSSALHHLEREITLCPETKNYIQKSLPRPTAATHLSISYPIFSRTRKFLTF